VETVDGDITSSTGIDLCDRKHRPDRKERMGPTRKREIAPWAPE
jgi:hypothetical protein